MAPGPSILPLTFNHVVFPPQLPGRQDNEDETEEVNNDLTQRLLQSVDILKRISPEGSSAAWGSTERLLKTSILLNGTGFNKDTVLRAFQELLPGNALILYIVQQNACLFVRKTFGNEDAVVFEAFEASPAAEQTLATEGALLWDFPDQAVMLPIREFEDPVFQTNLATFLEKASSEAVYEFSAKARKAGTEVAETRDTADPALITQFLMTLLATSGERACPPLLQKRIKDDVCWNDAELPWRRSPFWLILRVSIERLLIFHLGEELGRMHYKFLLCVLMAGLLADSVGQLRPQDCNLLKTKLCRRMAKLVSEKERSTGLSVLVYERMLSAAGSHCQKSITSATNAVKSEWESFKRRLQRNIPLLPIRAQPKDLELSLRNSATFFQSVLDRPEQSNWTLCTIDLKHLRQNVRKATTEAYLDMTTRYSSLAEREIAIESAVRKLPGTREGCEALCGRLAFQIEEYLNAVGDAYEDDPEQMGLFLLNLFEIWVHMDKCATVVYPLLKKFHPWVKPESLDVLLLSRRNDMERLQKIQLYLSDRCEQARPNLMTIFDDPGPNCFADQYFNSDTATSMHELQAKIERDSLKARADKETELKAINKQYQDLTEKKSTSSCTQRQHPDGTHDIRGCSHCYYIRQRRRLKIQVHEDFLPPDNEEPRKRAVVFELNLPKVFEAYRNATWNIIASLARSDDSETFEEPQMLLGEYSQLGKYNPTKKHSKGLTLASFTKSYLNTHYNWKRLPATARNILLPSGLKFVYYDPERKICLKKFPWNLTFAHHFAIHLPKGYPFTKLYSSRTFAVDGPGPSSYEAVASITECPRALSVHEYLASHNLMGGKARRWLSIILELGSSNVNFGLRDTMALIRVLALQAGPELRDDNLRLVHVVFRDFGFCKKLQELLHQHIDIISVNWREVDYMETILILALQLWEFCCADARAEVYDLLRRIRRTTLTWIVLLRDGMRSSEQADMANQAARHCLLSALLCRRTFVPQIYGCYAMDPQTFADFLQASLAMREGLIVDITKFTSISWNMLVRDIKMAPALLPKLRGWVEEYPRAISEAIDATWPTNGGADRKYGEWQFVSLLKGKSWVTTTARTSDRTNQQIVHFDLIQGHLLFDGQTIGKLPTDITDSPILKELFGNQKLFALPSDMPGMQYVLVNNNGGHQIHIGYRNKELVIRARRADSVLELVPRLVFGTGADLDLPAALIEDCTHWLDLETGLLQVRRRSRFWNDKYWVVDIPRRRAQRNSTCLIDQRSKLFLSIARIFRGFEEPRNLMVTQSSAGPISVELKRMNLTFHVNRKNLLQCKQLPAEVDPDQDAGTFYGLQSMLVLRNVYNRSQRSIIVPLGMLEYQREGMHVMVRIRNGGAYARYTVDNTLGRLRSPQDLRILFMKALLHAYTSCFIPDPLTGHTGTEEALLCLQSGQCQPWAPLSKTELGVLQSIADLTVQREYYPRNKKRQQIVRWNPNLTPFIQHDAYLPVVNSIITKSHQLSRFYLDASEPASGVVPDPSANPHLRVRAFWRRFIYERPEFMTVEPIPPEDQRYDGRGGWVSNRRTANVREIVDLIKLRPSSTRTTLSLEKVLDGWPFIGGYTTTFDPNLLEDYLSTGISHHWGGLVRLCKECPMEERYTVVFKLGLVAFRDGVDMTALRVIAAFFVLEDLKTLRLPHFSSFTRFKVDETPTADLISSLVTQFCEPFKETSPPRKRKKKQQPADEDHLVKMAQSEHEQKCNNALQEFTKVLLSQWPCRKPSVSGLELDGLDVTRAATAVSAEWRRLYANFELANHIKEVQPILEKHYSSAKKRVVEWEPLVYEIFGVKTRRGFKLPRLHTHLIQKEGPSIDVYRSSLERLRNMTTRIAAASDRPSLNDSIASRPEILEIEGIVNSLLDTDCPVRLRYGNDLKESIAVLKVTNKPTNMGPDVDFGKEIARLNAEIWAARTAVNQRHNRIRRSMSHDDPRHVWLEQCSLWPSTGPISLLQQLRSTSRSGRVFGPGMEMALVSYGQSILELQRLIRIKESLAKGDKEKLHQELRTRGHVNWQASEYPDWLLLELDADIIIRENQVTVAKEMIDPNSGANSVLQMNMGQGKTSVIMPMVASVLAGGEMLTRLVVPKALLSQTAQILQARLGGMLGRNITHIPFSRRTPTTPELIAQYRSIHEEVLRESGIILAVPEHVLSFKLSGLQRVSDGKISEATKMVATQDWMNRVCRDILDECDFTLAVRTQLVYPSGSQLAVDGHPHRWEVAMAVLDLVAHHLPTLAHDLPRSIEVLERNGFPAAHFLRDDAEYTLVQRLVDDICNGQTSILPVDRCAKADQVALRIFISQETVDPSVSDRVTRIFADKPHYRKNAYLLRGMLVHGILLLCLKKRWNVQYGLHPGRDPMAVPFLAKGVPSDQAEWGHPDVAILFTCLAFYYQGITVEQLRQALQAVLRSDDPTTEYDRWTQASSAIPESLCHWNVINVDDDGQILELWRHLRFSVVVINYFLRTFVFPVHAKQFSVKLQASGWDIPLFRNTDPSSDDDCLEHAAITTGFSGTNDNRRLLPLTIEQQDLPELSHTNAEVLTYLLQERNRQYMLASGPNGRRFSEMDLLSRLKQCDIRILIDAGAFILEMDNRTLVSAWLQQDQEAPAAVYFAGDNRPWVLYQSGKSAPLIATPFSDNMDKCLVYLDEAHTRGTDLKLPPNARGALTLALNQTKDHTVQAAMRLRQLGTTQSITFVAPPEVHQSILDVRKKQKDAAGSLDSSDVIAWLLNQTCATNKELLPLYYAQGADFCYRMQAAVRYECFLTSQSQRERFLRLLQQPEQQTLEQLYDPRAQKDREVAISRETSGIRLQGALNGFMESLNSSRRHSQEAHSMKTSALEEVEQEREVAYEVQEERELQRPRRQKPLRFPGLHDSILNFVTTGVLKGGYGYIKASEVLLSTGLAQKHQVKELPFMSRLYASEEMTRSIELRIGERKDNFTRPVNWILWNMTTDTGLVVIPEEAEAVIPVIRSLAKPPVHLILYAAPFTKRMLQFNRLGFYAIPELPKGWTPPSWVPFELGILAGRLYFEFEEYPDILRRLRLEVEDGSGKSEDPTSSYGGSADRANLQFLQEWLALRRHGQDISHTPMGYVCQGWRLRSDHPFFSAKKGEAKSATELFPRTSHQDGTLTEEILYDSDEDDTVILDAGDDAGSDHGGNMQTFAAVLEGIKFN